MVIVKCDLCDRSKECTVREIEGREYDICAECWRPLEEKLKSKGRKRPEIVSIPPASPAKKEEEERPAPGRPPKIWYSATRPN